MHGKNDSYSGIYAFSFYARKDHYAVFLANLAQKIHQVFVLSARFLREVLCIGHG